MLTYLLYFDIIFIILQSSTVPIFITFCYFIHIITTSNLCPLHLSVKFMFILTQLSNGMPNKKIRRKDFPPILRITSHNFTKFLFHFGQLLATHYFHPFIFPKPFILLNFPISYLSSVFIVDIKLSYVFYILNSN